MPPCFTKKINLHVWSLKEEINQVIMSKIESIEEKELIKSLIEDYSADKPALKLIKTEQGQDEESSDKEKSTDQDEQENTAESKKVTSEAEADDEASKGKEEIIQKIFKLSEDKISKATTVMSEIYMDEIYFFSETPFLEGQSIVVKFCIPQKFIMNADVIFCQTYSASNRVLGKAKLPYRVCAQFSFLKNGERTLLRRFLSSIEPELKDPKKEKRQTYK